MVELLKNCIEADDPESWTDLWLLFDRVAAVPLRRLVQEFGLSVTDSDDMVMNVWLHLLADNMRRLATFRGQSLAELQSWLVRIAINATLNALEKRCRRNEDERLVEGLEVRDHRGPSRREIGSLLSEMEKVAGSGDVRRLRILAGFERPAATISERTLRRWSLRLQARYGAHFSAAAD